MRNLFTTASLFLFIYFLPAVIFCQFNNSELPFSINEDGAAPDTSAIVDIQSDSKGLLIPRMPFCDIENIQNPAEGLMIFDTENKCLRIYISGNWDCLYSQIGVSGKNLPITGWSNNPLDEGWDTDIDTDSQDNVYVTSSTEDQEMRLIKYDADGNYLWDIFERGHQISNINIDQDDNVIAIGSFRFSHSPFDWNGAAIPGGPYPNGITFITRTTPDGTSSEIINIDVRSDYVSSSIDEDGNLTVASVISYLHDSTNNNFSLARLRVKRFDNNLNLLWTNTVDINTSRDWLAITDLLTDPDGNVYVTGYHQNGVLMQNPNNDLFGNNNIYVAKFANADGQALWYRSVDSGSTITPSQLYFSDDNQIVLFGSIGSQFYDNRYTANGASAGIRTYNRSIQLRDLAESGSSTEIALSVKETTNGVAEHKILFYNPMFGRFENSKTLTFSPYHIEYSQSGTVLYGTGEGTQIDNIIVNPPMADPTLVFKIQTN